MKIIYRCLLILAVFTGALVFFGYNMPEVLNSQETNTTSMSEAALPSLSVSVGSIEMNRLHGYASDIDSTMLRESVLALNTEQSFQVVIEENENTIKKFTYELTDESGTLIEQGSIHALERVGGGRKSAAVMFKEELKKDTEYRLTMTLVNSQSRKYYFYTRVKIYSDPHLDAHLEFAHSIHEALFDKEAAEDYKKYMESKGSSDTSTLAYVNIYSSFDLLTWGNLAPVKVTDPVPTVTDIYEDTASIVLQYMVSAGTGSGTEYYNITERYRVKYSQSRMYLLNYERTMEAVFDPKLLSLSSGEFKLGITSDPETPYLVNEAGNSVAFVRNRELWYYNLSENTLVKVFTFQGKGADSFRDGYDHHDVRLLNMDEDGNIDFLVYGYMNRGEYEGRTAMVLYRYYRSEGRIEEQVYIPLTMPWQVIKEEVGELCFRNSFDIFYFVLYNNLYSYDLTAKKLTVIAENLKDDGFVYSEKSRYAAWESRSEDGSSEAVCVLNLENGERREIPAPAGETIRLLGEIDDNMICGYAAVSDVTPEADGSVLYPMDRITIVSPELTVRKDYEPKNGYYVTGAEVEGNVITLFQKEKTESGYRDAPTDSILNQGTAAKEPVEVTTRVTDLTLTEYYLALPDKYDILARPKESGTVNTVIAQDTTVRIGIPENRSAAWYAASFGKVIGKYETAGEAVYAADQAAGTVFGRDGGLVWERGIKGTKAELAAELITSGNSVEACAKMLFAYNKADVQADGLSLADKTIAKAVEQYLKAEFLDLRGATLDEVLYYVYRGAPVIAFKDRTSAVLITAYDSLSVTYLDPKAGRTVKAEKTEAAKLFEQSGNLFFSYRN